MLNNVVVCADYPGEKWQSIREYPGYEVANTGRVRHKRKGIYIYDRAFRDYQLNLACYTLYKNQKPNKVYLLDLFRETWMPNLESSEEIRKRVEETISSAHKEEQPSVRDKYGRVTRNKELQKQKFDEMVANFDPITMSASQYMKDLRKAGYTFTSSILSAALKKKKMETLKSEISII